MNFKSAPCRHWICRVSLFNILLPDRGGVLRSNICSIRINPREKNRSVVRCSIQLSYRRPGGANLRTETKASNSGNPAFSE
jgi:hypothetical protein